MEMTYYDFIQNILNTRGRFACGNEYHERHHIVPRSIGGTNDEWNLIDLFAREHFEAHRLLALENPNNSKLVYAWWMMSTTRASSQITAQEYEEARKIFAQSISGDKNPMYGKPSPRRGTHLSEEQKQHLRDLNTGELSSKYGVPVSEETRQKMRGARLGKTTSDESRLKMRNSHLGKNMGADSSRARPIAQYKLDGNLIKVWNCIADASHQLNVSASAISSACKGKNKTAGGYQFRYANREVPDRIPPYINQSGKYQIKIVARCDEDWNIIDVWEGYTAAEKGTGVSRTHIGQCCNHQREHAGGYKWKILDKNYE